MIAVRISRGPALGGFNRHALAAKFACSPVRGRSGTPSVAHCAALAVELAAVAVSHITLGFVTVARHGGGP